MIIFQTNQTKTESGWEAYYISGATVGMQESDLGKDIRLYPNPSNQELTIRFTKPMENIEYAVYSIEGKLIQSKTLNSNTQNINIATSELSEG